MTAQTKERNVIMYFRNIQTNATSNVPNPCTPEYAINRFTGYVFIRDALFIYVLIIITLCITIVQAPRCLISNHSSLFWIMEPFWSETTSFSKGLATKIEFGANVVLATHKKKTKPGLFHCVVSDSFFKIHLIFKAKHGISVPKPVKSRFEAKRSIHAFGLYWRNRGGNTKHTRWPMPKLWKQARPLLWLTLGLFCFSLFCRLMKTITPHSLKWQLALVM